MLYAIEWIRTQLATIYEAVSRLLGALSLDSISSFLNQSPVLLVLYILAGLVLVFVGFRFHKLISSFIGGAVMGYLGWQIGTAINPNYMSGSILWALIFAVIGLFLFYFLYVVNMGIGAFLVCFAVIRQLFAVSIEAGAIVGVVSTAIYCVLLTRRHFIRTAIAGGALLGLITLHYLGYFAVLGVFAASIAGGTILQNFLHKRYEEKKQAVGKYMPNAPSPPTPEEIATEIAQEKADKADRNDAKPITILKETEVNE